MCLILYVLFLTFVWKGGSLKSWNEYGQSLAKYISLFIRAPSKINPLKWPHWLHWVKFILFSWTSQVCPELSKLGLPVSCDPFLGLRPGKSFTLYNLMGRALFRPLWPESSLILQFKSQVGTAYFSSLPWTALGASLPSPLVSMLFWVPAPLARIQKKKRSFSKKPI